jgi:flavodoxin
MKTLIVYFSRTGRTREVAAMIRSLTGGDLEEIREARDRDGPFGWLRSGMESMRKTIPGIWPLKNDPASYDLIFIGTPIWASNMSSPVRAFITRYKDEIRKVALFCTGDGDDPEEMFGQMGVLLGIEPVATVGLIGKDREGDLAEAKIREFISSLRKPN